MVPLLTNNISPAQFGTFSLIQMCGTVAGVVFYLGVSSALPRSYYDYDSEKDRNKVFSTSLYLTIAGAVLQITLGFFFKEKLSLSLFGTNEWGDYIFFMLLASALGFIVQLFFVLMRLVRWSGTVSLSGIISLVLNIGISYFLLVAYKAGVWAPVWGVMFSNIVILGFVLFKCRSFIVPFIIKAEVYALLLIGLPTIITSCATMVIEWGDRYFLNKFLTVQDVGIYTVGYKFASIITVFLIAPMMQVWNPTMMENRGNEKFASHFSQVVLYYFLVGSAFLFAATLFLGEFIYLIIPKASYSAGLRITPVVMLGLLINGLSNFVSAGLFYERKVYKITFVYCFTAVLYIGINYYSIPLFGYEGAAWGSLIIYSLTPFLIYQTAKKYYKIHFMWDKISSLTILSFLVVTLSPVLEPFSLVPRISIKIFVLVILYLFLYKFVLSEDERVAGKKIAQGARAKLIRRI